MKFSNRIEQMEQSPIRRLAPLAQKAKDKGLQVIHLNIGQPDIPTPPNFLQAINDYSVSVLEYAPSQGLKRTLETVQLYLHNYGLDYDLDEILITNGASEGLIFSLLAICDSGDEVLTFEPFYPNYKTFAQIADVRLESITTKIEEGFRLPSKEKLLEKITTKTKAILISNPGNPTGRVYTKEELDNLVEVAKEKNLFIIADEVYREFNFTDREFISFANYSEIEKNVILIDSISKKYSACGARIGSVTSKNKDFMHHILKLAQARLSVSTLDQIGAGEMDRVDDEYVYENRRIYKERRNVLHAELEKIPGIVYSQPEGAFYTMIGLPVEDAQDFIIWMIENIQIEGYTVLLTPAESFYTTEELGKNECRLSYCVEDQLLIKAIAILKLALQKYPG
ncbi:pyridoxal phosphate-dependent aminotransferase [Facklamia sp. DSM 111018]|uniref:Aminotransferase n=1 Tax=Facklamia lactis TaxID=2749967 RepID=A0ABS0LQ95_9LACT|nr:pyridoxal phosphate-dependent aminotransferase [Facklamia lactis]MBG9980532.1 pyridoxal phosphate-dependent aminotransferase [Facklamia lactis]MBG9986324.1 pyridoxal phosphate-dependent aminotransferase [Facklamia lactis]